MRSHLFVYAWLLVLALIAAVVATVLPPAYSWWLKIAFVSFFIFIGGEDPRPLPRMMLRAWPRRTKHQTLDPPAHLWGYWLPRICPTPNPKHQTLNSNPWTRPHSCGNHAAPDAAGAQHKGRDISTVGEDGAANSKIQEGGLRGPNQIESKLPCWGSLRVEAEGKGGEGRGRFPESQRWVGDGTLFCGSSGGGD